MCKISIDIKMSDHSQHSDGEMNYSNMSGDINASEDDEVAEELSEVKLLMSTPNRICAFVGEVIKNVLLTTDKVEDIGAVVSSCSYCSCSVY